MDPQWEDLPVMKIHHSQEKDAVLSPEGRKTKGKLQDLYHILRLHGN